MKMSQVARQMSVREFTALCSTVDEKHPGEKFTVVKIERKNNILDVMILFRDSQTMLVRLEQQKEAA